MRKILQFIAFLFDLVFPKDEVSSISEDAFKAQTTQAQIEKEVYPGTIAVFSYRHPLIRKTIWALKYRGNMHAARLLGTPLYETILDHLGEDSLHTPENYICIPIPRSPDHQRKHGTNQAELLATIVVEKIHTDRITLRTDLLRRTRKTESQTKTDTKEERFENVRGVFYVADPTSISGKHIVLVDDVVTTGATMNEARRTLLASGASSVIGIAAAH